MLNTFLGNIKRAFYILWQNPVFLFKRIFFELRARILPSPKQGILKVNGVSFDFDFNFSHKIRKMYFVTYQPIIAEILKKYLKPGDTFIDAGANIGYFSFVAAGLVGKTGQVHSFEPVPEYFLKLNNFAKINQQYKIKTNRLALGDEEKTAEIFIKGGSDIGNNTFFPELLGDEGERSIRVPVVRLDDYIKKNNLSDIKLIKIDVEGFEFPVLMGLSGYFEGCYKNNSCPAIACEVVPVIYHKLGYKVKDLFDYMSRFYYYPYEVLNTKKRLNISDIENKVFADVLFKQSLR